MDVAVCIGKDEIQSKRNQPVSVERRKLGEGGQLECTPSIEKMEQAIDALAPTRHGRGGGELHRVSAADSPLRRRPYATWRVRRVPSCKSRRASRSEAASA